MSGSMKGMDMKGGSGLLRGHANKAFTETFPSPDAPKVDIGVKNGSGARGKAGGSVGNALDFGRAASALRKQAVGQYNKANGKC
jgi:hypothetical protein